MSRLSDLEDTNEDNSATLIFPHHLFENNPALKNGRTVFILEEQLFFKDFKYNINFHKKKLVLHRASLRYFSHLLQGRGYDVIYVEYLPHSEMENLAWALEKEDVKKLYCMELIDYELEKRLNSFCNGNGITLVELEGPGFLSSREWINNYFKNKKRYFMTSFYIAQRKRLNILLRDGKPEGGKWGYDVENRKKIPKEMDIPLIWKPENNSYVREAQEYVSSVFSDNPGDVKDFFYPVTHEDAKTWFSDFIKNRLKYFGDYEDSISAEEPFLFHSIISSSLNIGLITPQEVVQEVINAPDIPLNSQEGFIRQIIGWREFMRAIYIREGPKQRSTNYLQNSRKMNEKIYWGETGIDPYDKVVSRIIKYAFAHHIERLMVVGNFMLLVGVHPDEIYRWFMEMFIDAYDWVMVPNVYGMSQYADGGIITTKPYFSSSNYLLKMSDFSRGDWCEVWDALFWSFMHKNKDNLGKNPRIALLKRHLKNKNKMKRHHDVSEHFLKELYKK